MIIWVEYLKFLDTFGTPGTVGCYVGHMAPHVGHLGLYVGHPVKQEGERFRFISSIVKFYFYRIIYLIWKFYFIENPHE